MGGGGALPIRDKAKHDSTAASVFIWANQGQQRFPMLLRLGRTVASCADTALQLPVVRATLFCFESPQLIIFPLANFKLGLRPPTPTTRPSPSNLRLNTAKMSNAELATSYAALILADDGVEITVSGRPRGSRATCARGEPRTDDGS